MATNAIALPIPVDSPANVVNNSANIVSKVKNSMGESWFITQTKEQFDRLNDFSPIQVFNKNGTKYKKYIKKSIQYIKSL